MSVKYNFAGCYTAYLYAGRNDYGKQAVIISCLFCASNEPNENVPLSIPYKGHLELSDEGFIHKSDFERLKDTLTGSDGKPYRNARDLASGSIRCLDANICKEREVSFFAFNILEGMKDSRSSLLLTLHGAGCLPLLRAAHAHLFQNR